jgi:hypothetical protein
MFVPVSVILTLAPATTAPLASVIVPRNSDWLRDCPMTGISIKRMPSSAPQTAAIREIRIRYASHKTQEEEKEFAYVCLLLFAHLPVLSSKKF